MNSIAQSLSEPSVIKRNMVPEVDHPISGKYRILGNPLKMDQEEVFTPAPTLGQNNEQVFKEILSYSDDKFQAMKEPKAI
ncbi:CoA transferase [Chloroflexota bacterium]